MPKLDELTFDPKAAPAVDMENLPEEFGDFGSPPYPGQYTFALPADMDFDIFKATVIGVKDQERVRAVFDAQHPLMVVAVSPENADELGKLITMYWISNAEFEFNRKGEKVKASEMAYILKGSFKVNIPDGSPNAVWATAFNKLAGQHFGAEVQWEAYCNKDKKRWIVDAETERRKEDDESGCGRRYAQNGYTKGDGTVVEEIPKESGEGGQGSFFMDQFPCVCGGELRCRPRLRLYGPVILKPAQAAAPATAAPVAT